MKTLFTNNWKFKRFEIGQPPQAVNADWQALTLPHDWLIYDTAKLYETGEGRYVKEFQVTPDELNLVTTVIFDGVYMNAEVLVNDKSVGEWKYGYTSFCFDISDCLKVGANLIEVRVRHEAPNTRWYSGAGIFRNVWLNKQGTTRIVNDGVYISSTKLDGGDWELRVEVETVGEFDTIRHRLCSGEVFEGDSIVLKNVHLWDVDNPCLYELTTELIKDGAVADVAVNPVGFRTLEFSPDNGFFLNGRYLKMHGVCLHHDLGALGSAFNITAARRQLAIMQDMGVNAVRTAHNPPAREFLDLCDEMGVLVIDEFLDMWEIPMNSHDYARFFGEWYERDVAAWIRRDRNHPSVIMWSLGNEIPDTHRSERGLELTRTLHEEVLKHDPHKNAHSTIGSNFMPWDGAQNCAEVYKLAGYNYAERIYDEHHEKHPDWFIYGSENSSAVRSRGVYRFPADMPILSFDDLQCSDLGNSVVGWGLPAEKCWVLDRDRAYCGGQFIWTGIDYIGEPTPYSTKNSYFGAVDTAGLPKAVFYFYKSVWNKKAPPFVKLFPHWDWNEGQLIDIIAYSNLAQAELFLNGKSLGRQSIDFEKGEKLRFEWRAAYEAGALEVRAYGGDGEVAATDCKRSFGETAAVSLGFDESANSGVNFVVIEAVDECGVPVENARDRVFVEVGEGTKLLGLDSGDSTDYDSYKGDNKRLFGGKLVAIIDGDPKQVKATIGGEKPLRRISLTADRLALDKDTSTAKISATFLPANADYTDITWKCILDTGALAEIAVIESSTNTSAVVKACGDGLFKVIAICNNGKSHPEIISELNFTATGLGAATKNPYSFVQAGLYDISYLPLTIIQNGAVSGASEGKTLIGFKNVDFGRGSETLRLYLGTTSYVDEVIVEVFKGDVTAGNSRLIDTLSFPRNDLHYDYLPYDFTLPERLSGLCDLCFTVDRRCVFGGFEFVNTRAFERIYAGEYDEIYGDSYALNGERIENIGNNVIFKFTGLDFGEKSTRKLAIRGFAPDGNSVRLIFAQDNIENVRQIEFGKSADYEVQEFDVGELQGRQDLSFVFLPGSNFNIEWFRFE
ncbi:MAG: DUF4982 domain-containing protein [Oscillospiraceae bacterium]|nr:DUF4982 domain-containing protein [Oscillospiraceae bacterium]